MKSSLRRLITIIKNVKEVYIIYIKSLNIVIVCLHSNVAQNFI